MTEMAQEIIDVLMGQITGFQNPYTVKQFIKKFAFDVRLPSQVNDSVTGEVTWAQSINPTKFITLDNTRKRSEVDDWLVPKRPLNGLSDLFSAWQEINYTATERQLESINIEESDNIYSSEDVVRSMDVHFSKKVAFCDSVRECQYVAASQRSHALTYCARIEDSKECSQSFAISWSGKIVNSMFVHDSFDLFECLFCSHMRSKRFCVANMQFDEEEYFAIKKQVIEWLLTSN